ncbi:MAG: hypothetical protein ACJ0QL_07565 [Parvicellaceae bacterium]
MTRPIKIKIVGRPSEVRMGSPYNSCELDFTGTTLDLPTNNWQDKFAWSSDNKYLGLIQWNFDNNEPGFHFYIIDTRTNTLTITERIMGLVNDMKIKDDKILYNKFLHNREKSKPKDLCCHVDEEYEIEK